MPGRVRLWPALAQVGSDRRPEVVHPASNRLVGDREPAFREQILDVAEAQSEPEIKPNRVLDDLWREMVPAVTDLAHPPGYRAAMVTASARCRDNARPTIEPTSRPAIPPQASS